MKRGFVVGEVWATRKVADLNGQRLKLVVEHATPTESTRAAFGRAPLTVAIDTLDTRDGQEVLIAYGSGARNVLAQGPQNRHILCDAAIALLVDSPTDSAKPAQSIKEEG